MVRAPFFDENGVKKGAWSQEEDDKLKAYIEKYGHWNWRELPKFAGLQRCGKSCRLRWMNYLRPGVKHGNYSKEEEEMIIELHEKFGNKWSKIAAKLAGRTDNEIKNYWHTHLKRRMGSSKCESSSSSGSEGKQYSPLDQTEDPMVVEESCVRDLPSYLILESSPITPVSSSTDQFHEHFTCESSATTSANWNIPQDSMANNIGSPMNQFEPLDYCSGDFWTQPFVPDLDHNHYRLPDPQDEFVPNSYYANFDDSGDLFYQVMNELP